MSLGRAVCVWTLLSPCHGRACAAGPTLCRGAGRLLRSHGGPQPGVLDRSLGGDDCARSHRHAGPVRSPRVSPLLCSPRGGGQHAPAADGRADIASTCSTPHGCHQSPLAGVWQLRFVLPTRASDPARRTGGPGTVILASPMRLARGRVEKL